MMALLDSFHDAFAEQPCEAGPDTTRLPGLIALARQSDACLEAPVKSMIGRVKAARQAREKDFEACRARYDEELVDLVEQNLQAYQAVEAALRALLEAARQGDQRGLDEAVDQLEQEAETLQATSDELVDLHTCGALICPGCGMPGSSLLCPTCGIDCFYPDPEGQTGPPGTFELPAIYGAIFEKMQLVLQGRALMEELFETMEPLEKKLLKAEDMIERVLADQPEDLKASLIEDLLDDCLEGLAQMRALQESRELSDLNDGWTLLISSSAQLVGLLSSLGLGTLA